MRSIAAHANVRGTSYVRAYSVLRSAHLERTRHLVPATFVYGRRNYDFDESLVASDTLLHRPRLAECCVACFRLAPDVLEVNEPLMESGAPFALAAILGAGARGVLDRRHVRFVTYAIENHSPAESPAGASIKARMKILLQRWAGLLVSLSLSRVAFGTEASARLYRSRLPRTTAVEHRVIPALPAACDCGPLLKREDSVVFVGSFSPRKGLDLLLEAWTCVRDESSSARLTVIGQGPLLPQALSLAQTDPSLHIAVDPPRTEVHAALREARVLVLLSRSGTRWREQVGLPIVEGLAHGCEVVTTESTGIASWLREHGHIVLSEDSDAASCATAILQALTNRRGAARVIRDLPMRDGRVEADAYLFQHSRRTATPNEA